MDVAETGDYFNGSDTHAYIGGVAATNLPAGVANYTGNYLGSVLTDGAAASDFNGIATMTIDFASSDVNGTLGSDLTLSGTLMGSGISGTATVVSSGFLLTNGTSGTFNGNVFGNGAPDAAGILAISEPGATNTELVGAFAVSQ